MATKLYWCSKCTEFSVRRKVYIRKKDNKQSWAEYCINKGCGYKISTNDKAPLVGYCMNAIAHKGPNEIKNMILK